MRPSAVHHPSVPNLGPLYWSSVALGNLMSRSLKLGTRDMFPTNAVSIMGSWSSTLAEGKATWIIYWRAVTSAGTPYS